MLRVPQATAAYDGGLPFVMLELNLWLPPPNEIRYQITGQAANLMATKRVGMATNADGTFEFEANGTISSPDEWAGCKCTVLFNDLGGSFDDEITPLGYIGDGSCDPERKLALVRLTLAPEVVRDLVHLWGLFSKTEREGISMRCDLVNLREWPESHTVGYHVVRLYATAA